MVERRPVLTFITHAVLILGVLIVAFPVYITFVASTQKTRQDDFSYVFGDPKKLDLARRMLDRCDPADLAEWGFDQQSLWAPYERETGTTAPKRTLNSYTFQRRVMLALKKDIDTRPHGKLVRKMKYYCDVLLRE